MTTKSAFVLSVALGIGVLVTTSFLWARVSYDEIQYSRPEWFAPLNALWMEYPDGTILRSPVFHVGMLIGTLLTFGVAAFAMGVWRAKPVYAESLCVALVGLVPLLIRAVPVAFSSAPVGFKIAFGWKAALTIGLSLAAGWAGAQTRRLLRKRTP